MFIVWKTTHFQFIVLPVTFNNFKHILLFLSVLMAL